MADEIPTEALQAAARAMYEAWHSSVPFEDQADDVREEYLRAAGPTIAAAAPYLITEGSRAAAGELIEEWAVERSDWKAQGVSQIVECRNAEEALGYATVNPDLTVLRRQVTKWEEIVEADRAARDIAEDIVDETPALMARYERELRAKIAAEIRAGVEQFRTEQVGQALDRAVPEIADVALRTTEWAARIAEGTGDHD